MTPFLTQAKATQALLQYGTEGLSPEHMSPNRLKFGKTRKSCGNNRLRLVFVQNVSFSKTSIRVTVT